MPHDGEEPGTPQEWLARAKSNLALAKVPKPEDVYWEDLCYNFQQAAEKALKAVLLAYGVRFPHVHRLGTLMELLPHTPVRVPDEFDRLDELTDYAVQSRYPSLWEPVTEFDHATAMTIAKSVVDWAEKVLQSVE